MNKILKCCLSVLLVISLSIPSNILFATKKAYAAESGTSVSSYEISYGVDSAWDGAFNAHINVKNISSVPIKNWCLEFSFEQEITNIWNAEISDRSNGKYVLNNLDYNRTIQPGETVGVGFTVDGDSSFEPTGLKLIENTSRNDLSDSECEIQFDVYSDWGSGFSGAVTITNISSKEISDWSLEFDFIGSIDSLWNGNVISKNGNHFVVDNVGYNDLIKPGDSVTVGFNASRSSNDYPTNFLINCAGLRSETTQVFEVIFDCLADDAFNLPEKQIVISGEAAVEPNSPSRVGYSFAGWFLDSSRSSRFDFSIPIENNTILYAGWTQIYDNLTDDIIDLGDIEYLVANGKIDVTYGGNGRITSIYGDFYGKAIESAADYMELLIASASLWSNDFYVNENEIYSKEVDLGYGKTTYYTYNPIRGEADVRGSEIKLMVGENGKVEAIFNNYEDKLNSVNVMPSISEEEAEQCAIDALIETDEVKEFIDNCFIELCKQNNDVSVSKEEIIHFIVENMSKTSSLYIHCFSEAEDPRLIYEVNCRNNIAVEIGGKLIRLNIAHSFFIFANGEATGQVCMVIDNNHYTTINAKDELNATRTIEVLDKNVNGIDMQETFDIPRKIVTYQSIKTSSKSWLGTTYSYDLPGDIYDYVLGETPDAKAVSVHANMEQIYDYYKDVLNRQSYDGEGTTVTVSYDYEGMSDNAYWSPQDKMMVIAKEGGLEKALDVLAHEYTHAVSESIVGNGGLVYKGETGALNEAYSDILGNIIEGKNGTDDWIVGEDSDVDSDLLRSMSDPASKGYPDNYSDWGGLKNWLCTLLDNGGVHYYNGIFTKAAYIMMTDSRTTGITSDEWAKVFYESLFALSTNATFLDAREAIVGVAKKHRYTSDEITAIKEAFDSVGIVEKDTIRFVLTWGQNPYDLDAHLLGPTDNGRFHVYFANKDVGTRGTSSWDVDLDYDDTSSYGPEVITVRNLFQGEYYYVVRDYTNGYNVSSKELSNSGATLKIYRGNDSNPLYEYTVTSGYEGTYWNVCEISIDKKKKITVTPILTYSNELLYY